MGKFLLEDIGFTEEEKINEGAWSDILKWEDPNNRVQITPVGDIVPIP